ncbi:MAG: hypothetical protein ACOX7H_00180 [Bacillota bacterium]
MKQFANNDEEANINPDTEYKKDTNDCVAKADNDEDNKNQYPNMYPMCPYKYNNMCPHKYMPQPNMYPSED